jgi:GNAT superfamily N-acetyltransferase
MNHALAYKTDVCPDPEALQGLYRSVGWSSADPIELLHRAVAQSGWVATAWDADRLVGLARVLTDGVSVVYFQDLLVHPAYHHQGVGKQLLDLYEEAFGQFRCQVVLTEVEWVRAKFEKRGFHREPAALSRPRPLAAPG